MVTFKYRNIIMSSPIVITISTITLVVLLMINSCTFYLPSYILKIKYTKAIIRILDIFKTTHKCNLKQINPF